MKINNQCYILLIGSCKHYFNYLWARVFASGDLYCRGMEWRGSHGE